MSTASHPAKKPARDPRPGEAPTPAQRLDDERKRLLAAILELASLMRRPEPRRDRSPSGLGLGAVMREHGLGPRHISALLSVALHGPMTVTQLAKRHHVTLKTASLITVELEQAGLIDRREDPADRRRTIITIAKGRERAVNDGLSKRAADLQRTIDRLTPSQRDGLITGLEILAEEMAHDRS
jgi:DNA-binding MarR family transcriptional regulator